MKKEGTNSICISCGCEYYVPPKHRALRSCCSHKCKQSMRGKTPLADRFFKKVDSSGGVDACHLWTGAILKTGYGSIRSGGRALRSNRVAYELAHNTVLTEDQHGLHKCDNRKCVNPLHLFLGTPKTNSDDKHEKGRANPHKKFSDADIAAMKGLKSLGHTGRYIASVFGASEATVSMVTSGKRRKHL